MVAAHPFDDFQALARSVIVVNGRVLSVSDHQPSDFCRAFSFSMLSDLNRARRDRLPRGPAGISPLRW